MMRIAHLLLVVAALLGLCRAQAAGPLVINEIHADPHIKTQLIEFIELFNPTANEVDVSNWRFTDGVNYTFPTGTKIAANGYLVVTENLQHFQQRFSRTALGPWTGRLSSSGELITLRDATGRVVDEVEYKLGFPWPTFGEAPGHSLELVNPSFDNDLGGNWRAGGAANPQTLELAPTWKYFKGTAEPSNPTSAWRQLAYNDAQWLTGVGPFGYGENFLTTTLNDMRNNYSTIYLRREFTVADPSLISALTLRILFDDGVNIWINGQHVFRNNYAANEAAFNTLPSNKNNETGDYENFDLAHAIPLLRAGRNVIAIQAGNSSLTASSDFYIDAQLVAGSSATSPTPGRANSVLSANIGPLLRQVTHTPQQPKANEPVTVTVKATDSDGVQSVKLLYQVVNPGSYIELTDPAYLQGWVTADMHDDGANGDAAANDGTFTVVLPASVQTHRRLVRYRFLTIDTKGLSTQAPYGQDPVPNFAYFVYNGVPDWRGAIQPGSSDPTRAAVRTYTAEEMSRLPVYHVISKKAEVETATWTSGYGGSAYPWTGTLVYDGEVYDHINFRARGGVWRYAMVKNMWKFDFHRGHDFQAKDNWGREYSTRWTKLNLGANIQQGNFEHRGEQGMFESVGLRLFNLAGVEGPKTHWIQLRIIDEAQEAPTDQYNGDFWGLYLAVEQEDKRFLDEHELPDGNLYKMEGGTGDLNNLSYLGPDDKSDLNSFQNAYRGNQTDAWWRQNFDLDGYYSYHSIVQGIHHYDISFGKNYFYFRNPETGKWSVLPWDLDLTWADNMYENSTGGRDDFTPVLSRATFKIEFANRVRELRDLLFNSDQAHEVIDEYANIVKGTNAWNILGADRSMWDYNPRMTTQGDSSKAGIGRFYQFRIESATNSALRGSFDAVTQIMKHYVDYRGAAHLDPRAADPLIPNRPQISAVNGGTFPLNKIRLRSTAYSGPGNFAAMKWRIGEVTPGPVTPTWPAEPRKYEIDAVWQTPEIAAQNLEIDVPGDVLKPGHTYRARVRMKDTTGRWSHWSNPLEFTAGAADTPAAVRDHLRITEMMYEPPNGSEYEFIELHNTSESVSLPLVGVSFTQGISYTFGEITLPPLGYLILHKAETAAALSDFKSYYGIGDDVLLAGPYSGSLNNAGETVRLSSSAGGDELIAFEYYGSHQWPSAAAGAGHSLIPTTQGLGAHPFGALDYPGFWRASAFIKGSPGRADSDPGASLVINEVMAHTDAEVPGRPEYDSNDWIEIHNPTGSPISTEGWFLSDNAADLRRWALPARTIAAGGYVTFSEIGGFHDPITTGFGLDKNGETVFLTYFPTDGMPRVVDAVEFEGQSASASWGRDPIVSAHFRGLSPTPVSKNVALPTSVVITEVGYELDNALFEYIELHNVTGAAIALHNSVGSWRVNGGTEFTFPANFSLGGSERIVIVAFDPATDSASLAAFRSAFNVPATVRILGPLVGRLGNQSDRVTIEYPEAPDVIGGNAAWVIVDEVVYAANAPWPVSATQPRAIERIASSGVGDAFSNWRAAAPTPGTGVAEPTGDRDRDGLPDDWEITHGLNPNLDDANLDFDGDGLSNASEFRAGTAPNDAASAVRFVGVSANGSAVGLHFLAVQGRRYQILTSDTLSGSWNVAEEITHNGASGSVTVTVPVASTSNASFYRLVIP